MCICVLLSYLYVIFLWKKLKCKCKEFKIFYYKHKKLKWGFNSLILKGHLIQWLLHWLFDALITGFPRSWNACILDSSTSVSSWLLDFLAQSWYLSSFRTIQIIIGAMITFTLNNDQSSHNIVDEAVIGYRYNCIFKITLNGILSKNKLKIY